MSWQKWDQEHKKGAGGRTKLPSFVTQANRMTKQAFHQEGKDDVGAAMSHSQASRLHAQAQAYYADKGNAEKAAFHEQKAGYHQVSAASLSNPLHPDHLSQSGAPHKIVQQSAKQRLLAEVPEVANHPMFKEYAREAEDQDGPGYWDQFKSGKHLKRDFNLYKKAMAD